MKEDNIRTKSHWALNCKEATFLTELNKEGKLSGALTFRLWYHLVICASCKQFKKHTLLLAERLKQTGKNSTQNQHTFTDSEKKRLQEVLYEAWSGKN